jgi:hypothetical protein
MVAATLMKMNYSTLLEPLYKSSPVMPNNPMPTQRWDPLTLAEAEATHNAEGDRQRLSRLEQDHILKKTAERTEASRLAAIYRARMEELSKTMKEMEAAATSLTKPFARQRDAATVHRLVVARHMKLLQLAAIADDPAQGPFYAPSDRSLLPPYLQGNTQPPLFGQPSTAYLPAISTAPWPVTPTDDALQGGMLHQEEASME